MEREFYKPPQDPNEEIRGYQEAIEATRRRIEKYGPDPDLEEHIKGYERQIEKAKQKKKMNKAA